MGTGPLPPGSEAAASQDRGWREPPAAEELAEFPWLAISQKYVKPGISSEMDDIRESIAFGWAADEVEDSASAPSNP